MRVKRTYNTKNVKRVNRKRTRKDDRLKFNIELLLR